MTGTVSTLSIICMAISGIISFAIPVVLFIYFRKKKKADVLPFFAGCAVMLLFALVLESSVHRLVFASPAGEKILNTTWLYALYGGLMAGLFEETGRFCAFKTVLKKYRENDANALMYGAGHGGFEAAALLGVTSINNIAYSVLINTGGIDTVLSAVPAELKPQLETAVQTLISASSSQFLLGGAERIFAVTLQIALSVLVWFAAKDPGKRYLYPLAIFLHFAVDALMVVISSAGVPMLCVECFVGACAAAAAFIAKRQWVLNHRPEIQE